MNPRLFNISTPNQLEYGQDDILRLILYKAFLTSFSVSSPDKLEILIFLINLATTTNPALCQGLLSSLVLPEEMLHK